MNNSRRTLTSPTKPTNPWGISMRAIRKYARQVAARFDPEKIILFGSYAYGTPNAESDVDIVVIMPARNQIDQAVKIRWEVPAPFPMDLIVRTPKKLLESIVNQESFTRQILTRGKVLYEKKHGEMGAKSRSRSRHRRVNCRKQDIPS